MGKVTAVDGSDNMLAVAKHKLRDFENVSFKNVDLRKQLPFRSQKFDGALLINVIHHLDQVAPDGHMGTENLKSLISEFNRVLKNGAPLIIVASTEEQIWKCVWYNYFTQKKGYEEMVGQVTKRFISLESIGAVCKEGGFQDERRIVPTSELMYLLEYYLKVNMLSEEFRMGDSSWRDYENCARFPQLLAAFKEAIDWKEIDKFIDQSEASRGELGSCTFLIYNKK